MLPIPTHLKNILIISKNGYNGDDIEGMIQCTCGCKNIKLKIYAEEHNDHISVNEYKGDYGFRIVGLCTSCKKTFDIFDMAKHGYDGFVCNDGKSVEDIDLKKYSCSDCKNDTFEVEVGIELEDQEQFNEEIVNENPDEFKSEDYVDAFDWITISLKCSNCGRVIKDWVNFETA